MGGSQQISGCQKICGTHVVYGNQIVGSRKPRRRQRITGIKPVKKEQSSRAVEVNDNFQQRQPPVKKLKCLQMKKIASPATTNSRSSSQS